MLRATIKLPRRTFDIDAELRVAPGEIYVLFGPSAAGKTSLLAAIAGLEPAARATVSWNGELWQDGDSSQPRLPTWRRPIGYMEQNARLFPHLTVKANVEYGLNRPERSAAFVDELLQRLGLTPYLGARPSELSGGLAQRAALARVLARRPAVLLLDEPFTALDGPLRAELRDFVAAYVRERSAAAILVTHQFAEAQRVADRIGVLWSGRIAQEGSAEGILERPTSESVARLLGYESFVRMLDGRRIAVHPDRAFLGEYPDLGVILRGRVRQMFAHEGRHRVVLDVWDQVVELSVGLQLGVHPERAASSERDVAPAECLKPGAEAVFTLIAPPYFSD